MKPIELWLELQEQIDLAELSIVVRPDPTSASVSSAQIEVNSGSHCCLATVTETRLRIEGPRVFGLPVKLDVQEQVAVLRRWLQRLQTGS
jgi:hypothetical protein